MTYEFKTLMSNIWGRMVVKKLNAIVIVLGKNLFTSELKI